MNYKKINHISGWVVFLIASSTYILTLDPSVSFWDCGEFIACAHRLQVPHQPGAPIFIMIGKIFSLLSFGNEQKVAYWINMGSALASGATILFLFWTITMLAKKILVGKDTVINSTQTISIMGSGLVGSLAYTYSDTFWFSAVEAEVYALSSLCTAIVFWAVLKWEEQADKIGADRWLIFIAYVMGLSIGIHLLNLLVIPVVALVYYFRRFERTTTKGFAIALLIGVLVLGFVLWGLIQYTIKIAAYWDLFFVNTLNFSFGSGVLTFLCLLVALLVRGIFYSINKHKPVLNLALLCIVFILFGYSSFTILVIRAKANTNLNNSNPDNVFTLLSYLNRDQYGATPLDYGPYFDANPIDRQAGATLYRKGKTKYEIAGQKWQTLYDHNTILPRIHSLRRDHGAFYRYWLNLTDKQVPTFLDNLKFLFSWQIGQMYVRYFLWNFAGRQNNVDGQQGRCSEGQWLSGIKWLDAVRLGNQSQLPKSITKNMAYNRLYGLPLLLGILGAFYHFRTNRPYASVVALLFFFTGLAIVLYLNQDPMQPRERDYAYVGSFYAFAIWIGLGVLFIAKKLERKLSPSIAVSMAVLLCLLSVPVLMAQQEWDDHDRSSRMIPSDMAYNYLNSCAPNAILFTYGDNDTYPLWYAQEVAGIRPDVRVVNLSLLGTDWYIKQMKKKMNKSAPLPITMPDEKYVQGVRDIIYYHDSGIKEAIELKDIFSFITSDDSRAQIDYGINTTPTNYLPTKNMKITIKVDELIKNGTIPKNWISSVTPVIEFTYNANYVTKEHLALMDILVHNNNNNWERPIYFTITAGQGNMMGLDQYLYNEGFAYRLMPFKTASNINDPMKRTNTLVLYDHVINRFKWGNFKYTSYLDHESMAMFYPLIVRTFLSLAENLLEEGHHDKAQEVVHKYQEVLPGIHPHIEVALHKLSLASIAYQLGEKHFGRSIIQQVSHYVIQQMDYYCSLVQSKYIDLYDYEIRCSLSLLDKLLQTTKDNQEDKLNKEIYDHLNKYKSQLSSLKVAS